MNAFTRRDPISPGFWGPDVKKVLCLHKCQAHQPYRPICALEGKALFRFYYCDVIDSSW